MKSFLSLYIYHSSIYTNIFLFFVCLIRYKKLLSTVDLRKDFFFSYSYNIMCNLQKNLATRKSSRVPYESMFVWNEYLTREIRSTLRSNLWTVALVHGFFEQVV